MSFLKSITTAVIIIYHSSLLISQDLTLPPLQKLEITLTTFTELERNAQLKSYDRIDKRYSAKAESDVRGTSEQRNREADWWQLENVLTLPPLQELEVSLIRFTKLERNAKLKLFDNVRGPSINDLLPSLGVAYTPNGEPRPAASWSPLQILDRKEQNKKRKLDRESICLQYEILLTDRLYRLRQLYQDYQIDLKHIRSRREVIAIDEQLFAITERKYEENIIKPSDWRPFRRKIDVEVDLGHKQTIDLSGV